ncbi:MAG TPA: PH domain-containing protein [Bryobacteraceae bacterium]|jgi:hypothetical protein|nr:PH domain-containing protein [Bryobacteraceae bacterium]
MPEQAFSASYDSTTKAISAVVCAMLIAVAWMVHIIFVALLFPLLICLAYAYSTREYALSGGAIVVKRLIGDIRVPLADIREIRPGTPDDFTGCVRLWGNGGLFGYYGLFRTARLGRCYWYVTNRSKTVVVVTPNRTMVLSPDDVAGFIASAGVSSTAVTSSDTAQFQLAGGGGNALGKIVGIGIGAAALALVALAVVYSPGPPGYTLAADRLTIHDRFYPVTLPRDAIDAAHIRIVDLTQESEWRPTLRTNGLANSHYQSGWFRVAGGKTVRLYRAGGNRLVLIPPQGGGTHVLYQAQSPEQFVEILRRWAETAGEHSP